MKQNSVLLRYRVLQSECSKLSGRLLNKIALDEFQKFRKQYEPTLKSLKKAVNDYKGQLRDLR